MAPKKPSTTKKKTLTPRPPVVVIMGHVDHGKSTLLDYIRKTNIVAGEAGGITQHIYSYEITHKDQSGAEKRITFLDTPGHEAFTLMRTRGAAIADIAILVISSVEGMKPQSNEALKIIQESGTPYIVALTKMDLPSANPEKVKQELAERGVYVEGYGGSISCAPISAKTGEGVSDLIELILLTAELEAFTGDPARSAEGVVIESNRDPKKGVSAALLITNGTIKKGAYIATPTAVAPIRRIENFLGEAVETATFSSPIRMVGFDTIPRVGDAFTIFASKKEAEAHVAGTHTDASSTKKRMGGGIKAGGATMPVIIKTDVHGSLEAIMHELKKIHTEGIEIEIVDASVGAVSESDIKRAAGSADAVVVGFHVGVEKIATQLAEQLQIPVQTFDIIYRLTEWFVEELERRRPRLKIEEITGAAKVLRIFNTVKGKQVLGGRVKEGMLTVGSPVKILRREHDIGRGKITELQRQKIQVNRVETEEEFGMLVESKQEIAEGDVLVAVTIVEK